MDAGSLPEAPARPRAHAGHWVGLTRGPGFLGVPAPPPTGDCLLGISLVNSAATKSVFTHWADLGLLGQLGGGGGSRWADPGAAGPIGEPLGRSGAAV